MKKTGIIVATVAAAMVGLGSLAFATTPHQAPAPVNHSNVEQGNLGNDCEFGQTGPVVDTLATGGASLLGAGGAAANAPVAPISAPIQALNCTNVNISDVIDNNSNNDTRTATSTETEDSNNTETAAE